MKIGGWKTIAGMVLVALGGALRAIPPLFEGQHDVGELLLTLGAALGGIGLAHKIEKGPQV